MNSVLEFYNSMPFNKADKTNLLKSRTYPVPWAELNHALKNCSTVFEIGCGNGWLSHRIANAHPHLRVSAIDFVEENIQLANYANDSVEFVCEDFLTYSGVTDCIVSIGALHHIPEFDLVSLVQRAILSSSKYTFLGLYHSSRSLMFDYFAKVPEAKRFKLFKKMNPHIVDSTQLESWFRDQLHHPYETTISIAELQDVATELGVHIKYLSFDSDDRYTSVMNQLKTFEYTSCMVYILFEHD